MMNRNALNETAANIQTMYHFMDENLEELTNNAAIFSAHVARELTLFREYVSTPRTTAEITSAKSPVNTAIEQYNDEQRMRRIEELQKIPGKDAMKSYLENQCVSGLQLEQDKNVGWKVSNTDSVELKAYDFISAICSEELPAIIDACCIFVDNLAKVEFGETANVSRNGLHESYVALRKRKNWELPKDKKASNKFLSKQMTEICNMISFKIAPEMLAADVKYVKFSVVGTKSAANKAGSFVVRNDETIVNGMFRAMYTRYNSLDYEWQNKTGYDSKPARSVSANESMAENSNASEFSKKEEPAAGAVVTIGTAETK